MFTFEDKQHIIEQQINKHRKKWGLRAIAWMDFDDVKQLIKIHANNKWHLWDQSRPLEPWINKLINRRITNLIRDNYGNFSRPCLKCSANEGGDLCSITKSGKQCEECPLYRKWAKNKKSAHDINLPVSYDDDDNAPTKERFVNTRSDFIDYELNISLVHIKMKEKLKPEHFRIYEMLYINNMDDETVAEILGYKKNKYNNKNKYKQLENYKKRFILIAKSLIKDHSIIHGE